MRGGIKKAPGEREGGKREESRKEERGKSERLAPRVSEGDDRREGEGASGVAGRGWAVAHGKRAGE